MTSKKRRKITCPRCQGKTYIDCGPCNGYALNRSCSACEGNGIIECPFCKGSGVIYTKRGVK